VPADGWHGERGEAAPPLLHGRCGERGEDAPPLLHGRCGGAGRRAPSLNLRWWSMTGAAQ
jgi:hypothetical protein